MGARPETMGNFTWWLCLFIAPAVLMTIELFHPAHFTAHPGMYEFLSQPQHDRHDFMALHMIQTPMVGLVALGLWRIVSVVDSDDSPAAVGLAWLARIAIFVFLIYYTVLDGVGGIGLGRTIQISQSLLADGTLTHDQFDGVVTLLNTVWVDPWVGGVGSVVSQTGSWAVFAASVLTALSLLIARKSGWPAMMLLLVFGWELQTSHASPHGPIAFALLIVVGVLTWRDRRQHWSSFTSA
jgi:hypothetical protein